MICGLTVPEDSTPLEVSSSNVAWWDCHNGDLISWADPWNMTVLVRLPAARYHSAYSRVNTLSGPKWKKSYMSEGFILDLGRVKLTLNTATEYAFSDQTLSQYYYAPVYGRQLDLTVDHAVAGTLTKSTYISTQDSNANTDCWIMLDLLYSPITSTISIYGNGKFLLNAPVLASETGKLVLNAFDFKPTTISDPLGEIILTSVWPNDGATAPHYTLKHRLASGYPTQFVGISPILGYIEFQRGASRVPVHTETMDATTCSYIGAPLLTLTGSSADLPQVTTTRGVSVTINAVSDTLDTGICEVWWDSNHGSKSLGKVTMTGGSFSNPVQSSIAGYGLLRIVNTTFNMGSGAEYMVKNPLPLIVT